MKPWDKAWDAVNEIRAKETEWFLANPDKMKNINFIVGAENKIPRTNVFENIEKLRQEYGK